MLQQEKVVGHLVDALGALITTIRRERQTARRLVGLVQRYRTQNISKVLKFYFSDLAEWLDNSRARPNAGFDGGCHHPGFHFWRVTWTLLLEKGHKNPDNFPSSDCLKLEKIILTLNAPNLLHLTLSWTVGIKQLLRKHLPRKNFIKLIILLKEFCYGLQKRTSPTASICPFSLQQVKGLKAGFHLNLWKGKHQMKMGFLYFFPFFVQV